MDEQFIDTIIACSEIDEVTQQEELEATNTKQFLFGPRCTYIQRCIINSLYIHTEMYN